MRTLACLLVVAAAATAHAESKIAIVGLGVTDVAAAPMANALTAALRARTTGRFKTGATPNAIDAAVAKADCTVLDSSCAAAIGAILGVDYVLVGDLDMRGARHIASLSLVGVKAKRRVRSLSDVAPGSDAAVWAKSIYRRIIDVDTTDLVIYANAERGDVSIDGQVAAVLFDNKATITGLAPGAHRLAIHAKGFQPFDDEVTVDGTTQSILLVPE